MSACLDAFATTLGRLQRRLSCTPMSMEFTAVSLLLLVEGLPAGRRSLVPCVSNLDDQRCHFGLSATTERDRGLQTLCWSKGDSNSRSHRERKGRARAAQWPSREST